MKMTALLSALALALLPGFAMAQACDHGAKDQTASSCKDGMVWDAEKSLCVVQPSS